MQLSSVLRLEKRGDYGYLMIHNGRRNLLPDPGLFRPTDLTDWIAREQPKAIIVYGQGRHFSQGADLAAAPPDDLAQALGRGKQALLSLRQLVIPTVASVTGMCQGGGLELALSCDFIIASDSSYFSFPESLLGFVPGWEGLALLARRLPQAVALRMVMSGLMIASHTAYDMGLIDQVFSDQAPDEAGRDFLDRLIGHLSPRQTAWMLGRIKGLTDQPAGEMFAELMKRKMTP